MGKIQSRVGSSLSGTYDVRGGIQGLEDLRTQEVAVVHEMGRTIQSERFSSVIRRRTTGALGASIVFGETITNLPAGVTRILGVSVFADVVARSDIVSVLLRDPVVEREFPIFAWDDGTDIFKPIQIQDDGGAVGVQRLLVQTEPYPMPRTLLVGSDQPQSVPDIAFRGITLAFGAGTVTHTLIIHLAFAAIGGLSSRGLPVPSW